MEKPVKEPPHYKDRQGFWCVVLTNEKTGDRFVRRMHEIVAEAFVSNPLGLNRIGFKDKDKDNCRACNLYWY